MLEGWARDPVLMARELFGIECWDRQAELLREVAAYDRVAVRSGHKTGKSLSAALLAYWFLLTRSPSRVVLTSSSARQVKDVLWREVWNLFKLLRRHGRFSLGEAMPAVRPENGFTLSTGDMQGFSTDEPEKMAGVSGPNVLFLADEASGIKDDIFEAIEGNRAGGAKLVLFSQGTQMSGVFYDAFHTKKNFWRGLAIDSEETPNAKAGRILVPGLATREWVEEKKAEWGEDSPLYQVRVKGNFPNQAQNAIIGLGLVTEAGRRYEEALAEAKEKGRALEGEGALVIGVDVARFGDDDTVIQPRRGNVAPKAIVLHSLDTGEVAGQVLSAARSLRRIGESVRIRVDDGGIGGGVVDWLREAIRESKNASDAAIEIEAVNAASSAQRDDCELRRDDLWFDLRDWLKAGGMFAPDSKLEHELVAATYRMSPKGNYRVDPKEEMKKRLKRSPDRADALALSITDQAGGRRRRSYGSIEVIQTEEFRAPAHSASGTSFPSWGGFTNWGPPRR